MQIVILCGGLATRLYPVTQKIPKSMVEIDGRPFLEYQIELLKRNGIFDLVLCVGNFSEQIEQHFGNGEKFGVKIQYSHDGANLAGTGGALKKAEDLLEDEFLVMYGDSYLPFDFQKAITFFKEKGKQGLMTVFHNANKYEPSNVEVEGDLVKIYSKKEKTPKMEHIDYGLSIFKKETLKILPSDGASDLSVLHLALIAEKQLLAFSVDQRYYQVGSFDGLEEFKVYIRK
jgi:NDP-sugar pyrophosphorylase family protein